MTRIPKKHRFILAFITGVLVGMLLTDTLLPTEHTHSDDHHHESEEVHVHADFLMYINDKKIDLTKDEFQSSTEDLKHEDFHLHDNEGHILHRHGHGITFVEFLESIDFILTSFCLTTNEGEKLCEDDDNILTLFVNGEKNGSPDNYVINDEDRVLLYYGLKESSDLQTYLDEVTDEACIYSGTCPERGLPPPESCGLTCEI